MPTPVLNASWLDTPTWNELFWDAPLSRMFSNWQGNKSVSTVIEKENGYTIAGDEDGVHFEVEIYGGNTTTVIRGQVTGLSTTTNYSDGHWSVYFVDGANAGQKKRITAHTVLSSNQFQFTVGEGGFGTIPVAGDNFRLYDDTPSYSIQDLRYGGRWLTKGVINNSTADINQAFGMMMKTLCYLQGLEDDTEPGTPFRSSDNWHQATIWMEEVLRGLWILETSGISLVPYSQAMREIRLMCLRWALWLVDKNGNPGFETGIGRNYPYNHRMFLDAAALLWAWVSYPISGLYDRARELIVEGLNYRITGTGLYTGTYKRKVSGTDYYANGRIITSAGVETFGTQTNIINRSITTETGQTRTISPVGIFPELWTHSNLPGGQSGGVSGWDVSYQNSSIRFAIVCWAILPASETTLRASLVTAIREGCNFERQLLISNYSGYPYYLSAVGSTRINNGDLTPSGALKKINMFDATESFMLAASADIDATLNRQTARQLGYGQGWVLSPSDPVP